MNCFKIGLIISKYTGKYTAISQEILHENHALLLRSAGSRGKMTPCWGVTQKIHVGAYFQPLEEEN